MPSSVARNKTGPSPVTPVIWYLINLLMLPFIGFAVVAWLYFRSGGASSVYRAHAQATLYMSLLGAIFIFTGEGILLTLFGNTGHFWSWGIVWAIVLHTAFVLWGLLALARALNRQPPDFPRWEH
ncbi:hypothetical protein QQM79_04890 [Marinobacteraceae bacterium S3BR75-40.1]